ncbi:endo alpha-1,4 polygalactosaminidase [Streptomyces kunmingensis]|uniref:Endo alpha-1,4 polygalactosaminidase n=1 Tax=Streptomyces kunmingensis TaxID=68225 RepID=A0ABU6CQS3_9ACTN|nr:endo alpha-1,4 polygalactosaminidase [Streptomyces kunmingensis]MEB3966561.1 endo alpha-1,4 polygalactosaminidase [Streptomyces kunmingensis]
MIFVPVSRRLSALCLVLAGALLSACSSSPSPSEAPSSAAASSDDASPRLVLPTADMDFDYQIGGPYKPPSGVRAVSRDRTSAPADGLYNVCYVNAFQAQPDALDWWKSKHPDLLLRDDDGTGELVIDEDWDEALLDISTADKRERLADIVGPWIDGCADDGYQAVEPDNLDSYGRSDDLLKPADAAAFAKLLAERAHDAGLAIGQKNTAELLARHKKMGFDFAVAEECARYDECGDYASAYDDRVFVIEYRAADFTKACDTWGEQLSIVLRDLDVRPAGSKGYVREAC